MDTEQTYIKMCLQAREIKTGNYAISNHIFPDDNVTICKTGVIIDSDGSFYYRENPNENLIWLPRQDELQDIINYDYPPDLLWDFNEWNKQTSLFSNFYFPIYTIEQLWLCFIMSRMYHKTWNGEEWVNEEKH